MKILFLCGSLEAGRDGVGDYVRMLGEELGRQSGWQVSAMAIHDPYVTARATITGTPGFPMFRIPAVWGPVRRLEEALRYTGQYSPDWISVQFVPYAFHAKGLPVYLVRQLELLTRNSRVHLMLHEAWAGTGEAFRPHRLAHSIMQKVILKQLLNRLNPSVIHTHLPEYRQKLAGLNRRALELPLFSNIPVRTGRAAAGTSLVIGFFSQVACSPQILRFVKGLLAKAAGSGLPAELLLIGGQESRMREFSSFLRNSDPGEHLVTCTGFLPPGKTSAAIRRCSLGVTPVPRHALGKSGSVAAFLSHGIPVAAPHMLEDRPVIPGFFSPALQAAILTEPDLESLERARTALGKARHEIRADRIARKFLHDLNQPHQI
ncbi:MAG TPA: glycosyltransferase [Sphingobacteriaceae bacterium]